ncbi:MAG TPA: DUF4465 domain-containing protein [Bacteroides sp.]|nr:DUF4465 domain-containing protein [Bacteroides sp.]
MKKRILIFCVAGIMFAMFACEKEEDNTDLITFEELARDSSFYWNGSDGSGSFKSGNATFPNVFTTWEGGFTSWTGFAYSNHTDALTPGFGNQYSCYAGSGAGGSEIFALIADGDTLTFKLPERVDKISLANSTYAALSMRDGDDFAKKFGGADGTDPDFFHLIITGINNNGEITGTVTFVLADFTSADPVSDFITDIWTEIPLDALGHVKQLAFSFDSSDKGDWGINTPKYACIDNILGTI